MDTDDTLAVAVVAVAGVEFVLAVAFRDFAALCMPHSVDKLVGFVVVGMEEHQGLELEHFLNNQ